LKRKDFPFHSATDRRNKTTIDDPDHPPYFFFVIHQWYMVVYWIFILLKFRSLWYFMM